MSASPIQTPGTPPPGRGRRRVADGASTCRVSVRVEEAEYSALKKVAKEKKKTLAELARLGLMRVAPEAFSAAASPPAVSQVDSQVAGELRRIGGLLVRRLGRTDVGLSEVEKADLRRLLALVRSVAEKVVPNPGGTA